MAYKIRGEIRFIKKDLPHVNYGELQYAKSLPGRKRVSKHP